MSVEGTWKVTIKGPTGPQETLLVLAREGGVLTGTQSAQGVSQPISDCTFDGNKLSWRNQLSKPMKLKLQFSCVIDDTNTMSGKVSTGMMGSFPFTAVKLK
jgi:2,4-diaminopentanoate dehydrogenase